jgi:hypothetical protein
VPVDGTGDINNFTLIYVTNNAEVTEAFHAVGMPVVFDPTISYEFTYDSTLKTGELYVEAAGRSAHQPVQRVGRADRWQ